MVQRKNFLPLIISLFFILILTILTSVTKKLGYHVTYSATSSMPKGFYLIVPTKKISRNDIVEFIMPPNVIKFAKEKRWIPQSGLIIKYVFGIPQDHICIRNHSIWINNKKVARIYKFYEKNKLLPQAKICGKLNKNQYVLLSKVSERSFDSRYFGVVSSQEILGRAIPIFIFNQ